MTNLKLVAVLCALLGLTACQSLKTIMGQRDNGSFDYQKAQKLPPLQLPANQVTAPFVPLYQVPETTGANTMGNASQYQLPKPPQAVR